jgi:hypothetical protein
LYFDDILLSDMASATSCATVAAAAVFIVIICNVGVSNGIKCLVGNSMLGNYTTFDNCTICKKTSGGAMGTDVSTSSCEATCSEGNVNLLGVASAGTYCCKTDLCNHASERTAPAALVALATVVMAARAVTRRLVH